MRTLNNTVATCHLRALLPHLLPWEPQPRGCDARCLGHPEALTDSRPQTHSARRPVLVDVHSAVNTEEVWSLRRNLDFQFLGKSRSHGDPGPICPGDGHPLELTAPPPRQEVCILGTDGPARALLLGAWAGLLLLAVGPRHHLSPQPEAWSGHPAPQGSRSPASGTWLSGTSSAPFADTEIS